VHYFHLIESVYLCLKSNCFIYYKHQQLCLNSFWALVKTITPRPHKYLAILDHFNQRGWWLRFDSSFGGTFQAYPDAPGLTHAPFVIELEDGQDEWLSIVGGDRVASSNKKQLIKVQVARFDNLESYELSQVRISRFVV